MACLSSGTNERKVHEDRVDAAEGRSREGGENIIVSAEKVHSAGGHAGSGRKAKAIYRVRGLNREGGEGRSRSPGGGVVDLRRRPEGPR